jgi:hypothetical protein
MSFTNRTGMAAAAVFTCAATFGCGGGEKPAAQEPPATMAPATTMAAPATMPTVAAGDFGVPECDTYMKKYMACMESKKVPETARAMMRQQLDQTRAAWKQAAATPQGKAGLAMGCTQIDQQSGPAMKAYGCSW